MNGWGLTAAAAAVLALSISYVRDETCPAERTRITTRTVCERIADRRPVCEARMFVQCAREPEGRE